MPGPSFQSGITNRPPEHELLAAFDLICSDPAANLTTLGTLRELVHRELRSDLGDQGPATLKEQLGPGTGELGFHDDYDRAHLTITLGLAKSAFEKLAVPADQHPQDLVAIPWGQLGDANVLNPANGALLIQACSDDVYVCEHVICSVEEEIGAGPTLIWSQLGSQRYTTCRGSSSNGSSSAT